MKVNLLCAGAARGLAERLAIEAGTGIEGSFGEVGSLVEKFLAREPCELLVLTHAQVAMLMARKRLVADFCADLGTVRAAVAVRAGDAKPDVSTSAALRAALLEADAIHIPDPARTTAGIHLAGVLDALGIAGEVSSRLRGHPNGMSALRMLGEAPGRPIGCALATEIVEAPTVALVARLPREHEFATVYTAALNAATPSRGARALASRITGRDTAADRLAAGFEGMAIVRAGAADTANARELVFGVLAEYGLTPEPDATDADLMDLDRGFLADGGMFDVAVAPDGSLAACCGMKVLGGGRLELRKMYVRRDQRGQGLGQRLLDRALAWARGRGFPRVELETASVLKEAIALYRKAGFEPRPGKPDTRRCDLAFVLALD